MSGFDQEKKICPTRRDFVKMAPACLLASALPATMLLGGCSGEDKKVDVDLSGIKPGQGVSIVWDGKPVFVRHRTEQEIAETRKDDSAQMISPVKDADRVKKPEWVVVVGLCTHHGCTLFGTKSSEPRGDYNGWYCPCHAAQFDLAGRVRKGPAETNLLVPPYNFVSDTKIRIG